MQRKINRREAIATFYSMDYADMEQYQPGRTRVPVYQAGENYAVALRSSDKPPAGFGQWVLKSDVNFQTRYGGFAIWEASGTEEADVTVWKSPGMKKLGMKEL